MDVSISAKIHWILPESLDIKLLQSKISQNYHVRQETVPASSFTLYDTFDWRLFKKARTLVLCEQSLLLSDLDFSGPSAETVWKKMNPPKFWWDLPEGDLQNQLQAAVDVRALLPLMTVLKQTQVLRILNQDQKTVVFLLFCVYEARSTSGVKHKTCLLELQPVRGYRIEFKKLLKYLSALGIEAGKERLLPFLLRDLGLEPGGYSSKFSLELAPEIPSAEAFYRIVSHLFSIMRLNEQGIQQNIDTEFLHDYRVAIRRIRSALGQIKGVIPKQQQQQMSAAFSKLGKATNSLRDLDVYLLNRSAYFAMLPESLAPGLDPLFRDLGQEREQEHKAVVRWLKSAEYAKIVQACKVILEQKIESQNSETFNALRSIFELANAFISKRFQRILRAGRKITDLSPDDDLHRLRISCKKLRYLLEFFCSLYPEAEISRLIGQLKKLQDNLGDYNDLHVQQQHLQTYLNGLNQQGKAAPDTAGAIGGLITSLHSKQKKVRQDFKQRFRAFSSPQNKSMFKKLFKVTSLTGDSE